MRAPHGQTLGGTSEKHPSQQNKVISVFYILLSFRHSGSIGENSTQKSVGRYSTISMGFSCYPAKTTVLTEASSDNHSKFSHALFHLKFPIIHVVWAKQLTAFEQKL